MVTKRKPAETDRQDGPFRVVGKKKEKQKQKKKNFEIPTKFDLIKVIIILTRVSFAMPLVFRVELRASGRQSTDGKKQATAVNLTTADPGSAKDYSPFLAVILVKDTCEYLQNTALQALKSISRSSWCPATRCWRARASGITRRLL